MRVDLVKAAKAITWAREVVEHDQRPGDIKEISTEDLLLVVEFAEIGQAYAHARELGLVR